MLKKLRVDNYKSLMNFEFSPGSLNLVVGHNNAGKTNLFEAVLLISNLALYDVAVALDNAGGRQATFLNAYQKEKDVMSLEVECALQEGKGISTYRYALELKGKRQGNRPAEARSEQFTVSRETLTRSSKETRVPMTLIDNHSGTAMVYHENRSQAVQTLVPPTKTMLNLLYDNPAHKHAVDFRHYLSQWRLYDFNTGKLRSRYFRPQEWTLASDGRNLVSVLFTMKSTDERVYQEFLKLARLIEPKTDYLNFPQVGDEVYLYVEDKHGAKLPLDQLSQGTLRFFAMACLLTLREKAADQEEPPPVLLLEEPENGIYVGLLKPLFERLKAGLPKTGQFILSSHSPYLIDLFDSNLDDISIISSDGFASTLRKPDPAKIVPLLDEMSLGEIHFRELLAR